MWPNKQSLLNFKHSFRSTTSYYTTLAFARARGTVRPSRHRNCFTINFNNAIRDQESKLRSFLSDLRHQFTNPVVGGGNGGENNTIHIFRSTSNGVLTSHSMLHSRRPHIDIQRLPNNYNTASSCKKCGELWGGREYARQTRMHIANSGNKM